MGHHLIQKRVDPVVVPVTQQSLPWLCRKCHCLMGISYVYTLWLFNIAMENGPFIDDFPIKTSTYKGFSMAMLNNQMVHGNICLNDGLSSAIFPTSGWGKHADYARLPELDRVNVADLRVNKFIQFLGLVEAHFLKQQSFLSISDGCIKRIGLYRVLPLLNNSKHLLCRVSKVYIPHQSVRIFVFYCYKNH
jgi:hypothetical protein